MRESKQLDPLDYLIFSSHKTATQTLKRTLRGNGFAAEHCHSLENQHMEIDPGSLRSTLSSRRKRTGNQLKIITVFREPVERLVSSMFQWYGVGVIRKGHCSTKEETIVYRSSIANLTNLFVTEVVPDCRRDESLVHLAEELSFEISDLSFEKESMIGTWQDSNCRIHFMRFDLLVSNMLPILEELTERSLQVQLANISEQKWYFEKYKDFKDRLRLPRDIIEQIYSHRKSLVRLFYGDYEKAVEQAIARYGA